MVEKLKYNKLGRYKLESIIGKGAMGIVYKAFDPVIERYVAIKAVEAGKNLPLEEYEEYLERFYREAQAAGKLSHPNIVTIYDVSQDKESGIPYIVMEFIDGQNLNYFLNTGMMFSFEDTLLIIDQVADALNYAHQQKIVHRDIKCSNIMIQKGLKVKVMDFGIARIDTSTLTREGQYLGTPNYMSPEQIQGKIIDKRSDIFSLGIVFYRLLTGERPFQADSFAAISYKILNEDPIPPTQLNPLLPEGVNVIISKMLAKDPLKRYQSTYSLREDIWKLQSGDLILSDADKSKETIIEIVKKPLEKRKYIFLFLILAFLGIIILSFYFGKKHPTVISEKTINQTIPRNQIEIKKEKPAESELTSEYDIYKQFAINFFRNKNYNKAVSNYLIYLSKNSKDSEAISHLIEATEQVMKNQAKCVINNNSSSTINLSTNQLPSGYFYIMQNSNICLTIPTSFSEVKLQLEVQSIKSEIQLFFYSEKNQEVISKSIKNDFIPGKNYALSINYNEGSGLAAWLSTIND